MATYAISYRIHDDSSYASRRDSLVKEINKCPRVWEETTSFAVVESTEALGILEHRLYYGSDLESSKDKLLVIAITAAAAVARGNLAYSATLRALVAGITIY